MVSNLLNLAQKSIKTALFSTPLRKEIIVIIIIKLLALYGIWALCFSHPIPPKKIKSLFIQQLI